MDSWKDASKLYGKKKSKFTSTWLLSHISINLDLTQRGTEWNHLKVKFNTTRKLAYCQSG